MTRSIAVLLLVLAQAAPAHAADPATAPDDQPPIKAGIDLGMTSAYIWRGFVENDRLRIAPSGNYSKSLNAALFENRFYVGVTLSAK